MRTRSFRAWRNAILGTLLVLAGLGTALVTMLARRAEDPGLASAAAIASLVIVLLIFILVLPPLARSAREEVARFDFPLEVTAGGAIFLGILAIVAFAAWNTGNNLLFLVFSVLASTLFVAWAAARASLRDIVVSARFPDHIFAGEPAPVIVTLQNKKRFLPSFSILVEARGPVNKGELNRRGKTARLRYSKRALAYFVYVPHRAGAEQRVEQTFARRGHVLITGFELSTRFPFAFFRRRRRLRARDVDIIVYPKPEPASDELHLLPMNAGRLASLRRGAGHDLLSLRDYQPQDDLRHMDWKATARVRRLIVREFTAEDERRITIALDTRTSGEADAGFAERFERGVTLAASLAAHFIDERAEVRLVLGSEAGRYSVGREHLYDCLRRLALVTPHSEKAEANDASMGAGASDDSDHDATVAVADGNYCILLTTAAPGSIPSNVWRTSHVIYL
ncbi:MAG TPA: DUF58 domain-containing protein [Pyrinomonadaceae bacterium]|jgi:uncharacterized protein (DUF58 family)|nr:DUF58 domain-containing protein [Pyrinomonadaceae bacterium]